MAHVLLLLLLAIVVGAAAYGVTWIITGRDRGLDPEEPDGRAVPLPTARPLVERDVQTIRFDTALRGYRMDQVDAATKRAAYDIGYKEELIGVLEAELAALRAGEIEEADALRAARESAVSSSRGKATVEDAKAVFPDADDDDDDDDDGDIDEADTDGSDTDTVAGTNTVTDLGDPLRTTLGARDKSRVQSSSDSLTATSAASYDDDDDVADDRTTDPARRDRARGQRGRRPGREQAVTPEIGGAQPANPAGDNTVEVTATVIINAPAQRVFSAFTSWERQGEWIPFTAVRITGGDGGQGSTLEAVTAIGPAVLTDLMTIEKVDPPFEVRVMHTGKILRGPGVMRCTAMGTNRTQMVWHEWFQLPGGLAGKLAGPVLWPTSKVSLTQALKRFGRLVETGKLP